MEIFTCRWYVETLFMQPLYLFMIHTTAVNFNELVVITRRDRHESDFG